MIFFFLIKFIFYWYCWSF